MDLFDITIIGGGPSGLFAAFYAHLRQAKVKIIDSLHQLGGQPAMLYPEKYIYDVPGFRQITGEELQETLINQLNRFNTTTCLNETVLNIEKKNDYFEITTDKTTHFSKTIIIAMGAGAFAPRTLDINNSQTVDNIHYYVRDMQQYADKHIAILGGGDSAVDWALTFEKIAKSVTLIHRRPTFRALEHSVAQLHQSSVTVLTPYLPTEIITNGSTMSHLIVTKVKSDEQLTLPIDHLFVNYGFSSSVGELKKWQLELSRNAIVVDETQQTSIPGIFAIGDCATRKGKIALIATGFGEAPVAVSYAMTYINPSERAQPMHSSSLDL